MRFFSSPDKIGHCFIGVMGVGVGAWTFAVNFEQFRAKQTKAGLLTRLNGLRKAKLDLTGILGEIITVIFSFQIQNHG
jgi:hypothetical protein